MASTPPGDPIPTPVDPPVPEPTDPTPVQPSDPVVAPDVPDEGLMA